MIDTNMGKISLHDALIYNVVLTNQNVELFCKEAYFIERDEYKNIKIPINMSELDASVFVTKGYSVIKGTYPTYVTKRKPLNVLVKHLANNARMEITEAYIKDNSLYLRGVIKFCKKI